MLICAGPKRPQYENYDNHQSCSSQYEAYRRARRRARIPGFTLAASIYSPKIIWLSQNRRTYIVIEANTDLVSEYISFRCMVDPINVCRFIAESCVKHIRGINMATGSVYVWERCDSDFTGGRVHSTEVELPYLSRDPGRHGLRGRYVDVISHGPRAGLAATEALWRSGERGEARPNEHGNYIFKPFGGGIFGEQEGYEAAVHFGQVNVYYHVSLIAQRMNEVLRSLGESPLPKVRAIVNAHQAKQRGVNRDLLKDANTWVPVKGTKYRYPARMENLDDFSIPLCGELLFGPGHAVTTEGWLPRISGGAYLCDPSHNASFIYQAFGLHVVRHTADVQADRLNAPRARYSRPGALEYALSTYLAASMLSTPLLMVLAPSS